MARVWFAFLVLAVIPVGTPATAAEVPLNGHHFTIPDGFEITLAAAQPLVERPITAAFDPQGRLYVSDSSGTNDKIQKQLEDKPHRILRLEDTDGDGKFDESHVFADRMMFPEGTLFHDGSLYVAAPPSIWKLTDTNDDGVADERVEWFLGKTLTGCANDLHGPYLGTDGWIYWCKGAFAEQTHLVQGKEWKTKASHIFRCRPDGSRLEPVMSGGMDNPVDVAFLPNGERILSNTFIVHPRDGQRDGLLHAIYGGVFGKEQSALDGHPRTGELMPILAHMGPAAPCGLVRVESTAFGPEFADNLFCCQFNKRLVSRHVLAPHGASYQSADSDFVVSSNTDFHPTDILEDADGSLLIVDTGGWYKLCCPSSQLHKPDILGAIYRVRRVGAVRPEDPRGLKLDWKSPSLRALADRLRSEQPAVAERAMQQLAATVEQQGKDSPAAQEFFAICREVHERTREQKSSPEAQRLVRTMTRMADPELRAPLRAWLAPKTADRTAHGLAIASVGLWREPDALPELLGLLSSPEARVRRYAAEAIGRLQDPSAIDKLLLAADQTLLPAADNQPATIDRALEHAIIYALIEIGDPARTANGLTGQSPRVQRAAMIAVDQMPGGKIGADQVLARLDSAEPLIKETADWLVARHPEWGGALAGWFKHQLEQIRSNSNDELADLLTRHARHPAIQQLLAEVITDPSHSVPARNLAMQVMARAKPAELPAVWGDALAAVLKQSSADLQTAAILAARELPAGKQPHAGLREALIGLAADASATDERRLQAFAAVPGALPALTEDQLSLLLSRLDDDATLVDRTAAAEAIAKSRLTETQLARITQVIPTAGPLELEKLVAPFEHSTETKVGLRLTEALKKANALSTLRIDLLQQRLAKYDPQVHAEVAEVVALINVDAASQKKQLEERLAKLSGGDIRRGQAVFNSSKAACTACHRLGYLGGVTGPDLTHIGNVRTERDLLESILFPNLSFVRSFEPVLIVTNDGRILNGLIRNETATDLLLATGPNQEVRLARADIEEIRPSTVSIMPGGLDKQLTEQELADLVAFLKNAK